jgi:periplasmic divalent cation tolerance protein
MKTGENLALVLVTVPNRAVARKLARAALGARLIACANIVPGIESHYWWKGKCEKGSELLMIFKTTRRALPALEQLVLDLHPYDTPEFVVLGIDHVTPKYLSWWRESVSGQN